MGKKKYAVWWHCNLPQEDPDFETGIERVEAESTANAKDVARKQVKIKFQWNKITISRVTELN
jgi:hypothetical protein